MPVRNSDELAKEVASACHRSVELPVKLLKECQRLYTLRQERRNGWEEGGSHNAESMAQHLSYLRPMFLDWLKLDSLEARQTIKQALQCRRKC